MNSLIPFDINKLPDLISIAEKVRATRTPLILKHNSESIAVIMPLATALPTQGEDVWKNYNPKRVQQALDASAGALTGVDKKALLNDLAEQRSQKKRVHSF
jgi:hypothetical protein